MSILNLVHCTMLLAGLYVTTLSRLFWLISQGHCCPVYFAVVESASDLKYNNKINKMTHCCHQVLRGFTKQGCYNVAMLIMKVQTSSELKIIQEKYEWKHNCTFEYCTLLRNTFYSWEQRD